MQNINEYNQVELSTTNLKFLILDIDLTLPDGIDGNIRLVLEKK